MSRAAEHPFSSRLSRTSSSAVDVEFCHGQCIAPTGAAWVDPVAEFFIAALAFQESKEAWEGELVEGDDEDDDPSNPHIPIDRFTTG